MARVIHICGAPATGKTWLRLRLGAELGLPTTSIDDQRREHGYDEGWPMLLRTVRGWTAGVVETSGWHSNERLLRCGNVAFTLLVVCSHAVRRARLRARLAAGEPLVTLCWDSQQYLDQCLRMGTPMVRYDVVVDTSQGVRVDWWRMACERMRQFLGRSGEHHHHDARHERDRGQAGVAGDVGRAVAGCCA